MYKLWMCVLLLAIADQDVSLSKDEEIAEDAREFCASERFLELCEMLGFNPERRFYPQLAHKALTAIRSSLGAGLQQRNSSGRFAVQPVTESVTSEMCRSVPSTPFEQHASA